RDLLRDALQLLALVRTLDQAHGRSRALSARALPALRRVVRLEQRALEVRERGARRRRVVVGTAAELGVLARERLECVKRGRAGGERDASALVSERNGDVRV